MRGRMQRRTQQRSPAAPTHDPPPGGVLPLLFWLLLFIALPLAYIPTPLLDALPDRLVVFPENETATVFIPKVIVFSLTWLLGAGLVLRLWRAPHRQPHLLAGYRPLRPALRWLGLFLATLIVASLFSRSNLNFVLYGLNSRFEGTLVKVLESAWYSLVVIALALSAARTLPVRVPLTLMAVGACLVGGWTLLEAHGLSPLALVGLPLEQDRNMAATMEHQGFVAALVGVVLVVWTVWRVLNGTVSPLDIPVVAILSAALVASGGRAGLLATVLVLVAFAGYALRQPQRTWRRPLIVLGATMLLAGTVTTLTTPHAQGRLERLGTAVQGEDPAVTHRLIFWQIAGKAILDRPLVGYGPYALAYIAWKYTTPEQADMLVTEFLSRDTATNAVRIGKFAFYNDPLTETVRVRVMNPYGVHNYFLDLALASGLPALLLFIGFIVALARHLYTAATPLSLAALAGLATYLLYGMAWFATLNVDPVVWGIVGLGLAGSDRPKRETAH